MSISLTRFVKDLLRKPEAIPAPGAVVYRVTVSRVLRKPEAKIADDIVRKVNGGTVVDLGSGPGFLSTEVARKSPGLQVCGIDLSRQMVKGAMRRAICIDNVEFIFGNAARLPFKDNSIDLVVSTGVFHHLKSPRLVFEECYRVLKAGGEAWVYDGCPEVFSNPANRRRLNREYGFLIGRLGYRVSTLHGFSREEYQTITTDILEQTAFKWNYQMALTDIWMKIALKKCQ